VRRTGMQLGSLMGHSLGTNHNRSQRLRSRCREITDFTSQHQLHCCCNQDAASQSIRPAAVEALLVMIWDALPAVELLFAAMPGAHAHWAPLPECPRASPSAASGMAGGGGTSIASRRAGAPVMAQCRARQTGRSSHGPVLPRSSICSEAGIGQTCLTLCRVPARQPATPILINHPPW